MKKVSLSLLAAMSCTLLNADGFVEIVYGEQYEPSELVEQPAAEPNEVVENEAQTDLFQEAVSLVNASESEVEATTGIPSEYLIAGSKERKPRQEFREGEIAGKGIFPEDPTDVQLGTTTPQIPPTNTQKGIIPEEKDLPKSQKGYFPGENVGRDPSSNSHLRLPEFNVTPKTE